jgi:hypothetical protein
MEEGGMECQIRREKKRREWDSAMKEVIGVSGCSEMIRLEE